MGAFSSSAWPKDSLNNLRRSIWFKRGRRAGRIINISKRRANPILARVGAYYHDIGKTLNPDGFVENQISSENIHESLTPEQSVNLIRNHVSKGIELAEKNKLPKEIIDFIPMHHGTMVITFFTKKLNNYTVKIR
ncbi:MAG: HDIG domain-containing protein, partial [Chitinispirillaceae bacterium]|nr:HDIG domain-containing protein [Chitinispirillaceae bacterium]